jgi:hypothetical protein
MAILADTHKIYSKLVEAGFEKSKADALVESFSMAQGDLVTKEHLDHQLDNLRKDLLIQMWSIGTIIIGVMAAFNFLG